ncbi:hypothetical protein HK104_003420 [Borealophlyctis nickersoniae]|nr:hypothetical protein HK104_003420 [Borealophlyctis nickersoniae]
MNPTAAPMPMPPMGMAPMLPFMPGMMPTMGKIRRHPSAPPCEETIYIRNLAEKKSVPSKESLPQFHFVISVNRRNNIYAEMLVALKTIFGEYGNILEVKYKRNVKMRGQAFLTFENLESAKKAVAEVKGFPLFGQPMDVQFARDRSLMLSKQDGTLEEHQRRRAEEKAKRAAEPKKPKPQGSSGGGMYGFNVPDEFLPPNSILFVQNLPPETNEIILAALFKQFQGFKEVRLVPGKSDIAFVEYDSELQSAAAKAALHGFKITQDKAIKVTFAKK